MKKPYIQPVSKMLNVYTSNILDLDIGSVPIYDEAVGDDDPQLVPPKDFDPWE